jgi:hypothetical protein
MRILAAEFEERDAARRALDHLDHTSGLPPDAAVMRPFVHIEPGLGTPRTIVAAYVPRDSASGIRDSLEADGGHILVDMDARRSDGEFKSVLTEKSFRKRVNA